MFRRLRPCAESWGTSGPSRPRPSSSRDSADWSTAATTRPAWHSWTRSGVVLDKRAGKLANLDKALAETPLPESHLGIGHTRWATHGAPTDQNAHPHLGSRGRVALVHNGILENFAVLRNELERLGHEMRSETDTEVAAHLLENLVEDGADLTTAMQRLCGLLEGAFTLVAVDSQAPDRVVAARRNSPLVVGLGDGENFVASDVAAFIEHTRQALELGQDQVVTITRDDVSVSTFDGTEAKGREFHVDWDLTAAEKDGFDWFMRKEIFEQPRAVRDSLLGRHDAAGRLQLDELRLSEEELRDVDKIVITACGTAFYAGLVAKYAIEHWTRIPCEVELRARVPLPRPDPDPRHAGGRDQPVRRDRRHPHGDPARTRAARRRCSRSATPTAPRSRASRTRSSTPTPGPRSASRRPRGS